MSNVHAMNDEADDLRGLMRALGAEAREAAAELALADPEQKAAALEAAASALRAATDEILHANDADMEAAEAGGTSRAFLDRLKLTPERIEAMAAGVEMVAELPDPVGRELAAWERPNGLKISRVAVPLGVIGIVYESRPNVTADAGALCLKAGNAAILRGGSDSYHSSRVIHACLVTGLKAADLPEASIQLVPTIDRAAVGIMLAEMADQIDVIVPRGGKSLVARIQKEARVPVLAHLEGLCHVYIDGAADLDMARKIAVNAKMRRTGICGAAETLLVDRACADTHLAPIVGALLDAGCAVRGDEAVRKADPRVTAAAPADWDTEYLDAIIAARVVDGLDGAIDHIRRHSSAHTECVVTEDAEVAEAFLSEVDSAILLWNASTQFADGGEFGMGAEIGIATGKLHARGPVGVEQLTSYKYVVRGSGQTRP